jgi:acetoin utilization deacetylase AcuC-like enzyme
MNWNNFQFFYTDHIHVPLTPGHRFPMVKYRMLREKLLEDGILAPSQLLPGPKIEKNDLLRAHDINYVDGLLENTLGPRELRSIGLTWGPELLHRSLVSVGGFVAATDSALKHGFSALLAGGTHHAHFSRGEGYCVFNDFAVAALRLLDLKKVKKILILDLDVHQGNGNSSILGNRKNIFIVSLHGEKNYPFRKVTSHIDVALPPGTGDEEYLEKLDDTLKKIPSDFDMIFYQAGVDNLKEDTLGTLNLSLEGLMRRDQMVFEFARHTPLAMAIGGGYSSPIELTVSAHANTFMIARSFF